MGSVDDGALGNQHKMLIAFNHGVKVRNRIKHGDVTAIGHFVLKFLSEYTIQENDRCCVGISVIVMSLYTFGLSMEEIEIFLDNRSNQHDFREEYRLNRKIFMAAG